MLSYRRGKAYVILDSYSIYIYIYIYSFRHTHKIGHKRELSSAAIANRARALWMSGDSGQMGAKVFYTATETARAWDVPVSARSINKQTMSSVDKYFCPGVNSSTRHIDERPL